MKLNRFPKTNGPGANLSLGTAQIFSLNCCYSLYHKDLTAQYSLAPKGSYSSGDLAERSLGELDGRGFAAAASDRNLP